MTFVIIFLCKLGWQFEKIINKHWRILFILINKVKQKNENLFIEMLGKHTIFLGLHTIKVYSKT